MGDRPASGGGLALDDDVAVAASLAGSDIPMKFFPSSDTRYGPQPTGRQTSIELHAIAYPG